MPVAVFPVVDQLVSLGFFRWQPVAGALTASLLLFAGGVRLKQEIR